MAGWEALGSWRPIATIPAAQERGNSRMDKPGKRSCPFCGSGDYTFRNRRQVVPKQGEEGPDEIETKYRCRGCSEEWRVRTEGRLPERKAEE